MRIFTVVVLAAGCSYLLPTGRGCLQEGWTCTAVGLDHQIKYLRTAAGQSQPQCRLNVSLGLTVVGHRTVNFLDKAVHQAGNAQRESDTSRPSWMEIKYHFSNGKTILVLTHLPHNSEVRILAICFLMFGVCMISLSQFIRLNSSIGENVRASGCLSWHRWPHSVWIGFSSNGKMALTWMEEELTMTDSGSQTFEESTVLYHRTDQH